MIKVLAVRYIYKAIYDGLPTIIFKEFSNIYCEGINDNHSVLKFISTIKTNKSLYIHICI